MRRNVLVIAAAFGIVIGGLLSTATKAAPGNASVASVKQNTVPAQTPKKHKKHHKHHKPGTVKPGATKPTTARTA